ncbi:MAG: DUF2079 domain-containing protein [Oscillospiraceae bacterium]|nr:DUF2079 domain-containing protein [Oscillospiraceae bacterium]
MKEITEIIKIKMRAVLEMLKQFGIPDMLLARFAGVYFWVSACNILWIKDQNIQILEEWKEFITKISPVSTILWMILGFMVLSLYHFFTPPKLHFADAAALFSGLLFFSLTVIWRCGNSYLCFGVDITAMVFIFYMMGKINHDHLDRLPLRAAAAVVGVTALIVVVFVSMTTICRHKVFTTAGFDFGVFMQMFHSLAKDLTAVTTFERNMPLSHFNVHASYIFYLMTPIYAIFPHAETLLIVQALLAAGGVVPLFLIARNRGFKGASLVLVCTVYLFCAGIMTPCFFDFHENAFLPTLLMWLFYAVERKNYILFYIMSALVCIVKEDAPLYVICISLFLLFEEKGRRRLHGLLAAVLSFLYFAIINNWLMEHGDGQMMSSTRLGILTTNPEAGFAGIAANVLTHPAYFFSLLITEESVLFVLQSLLPLLFLPMITKKIHRFWLLVPYIIMNLVIGADYPAAAQIGYQYSFGTACVLVYMAVINCADMEREKRNTILSACAVLSILLSVGLLSDKYQYVERYREKPEYYRNIETCLDAIPEDACVIADSWIVPHVADRDELYQFDISDIGLDKNKNPVGLVNPRGYDFFVLNRNNKHTKTAIPFLEAEGFTVYAEAEGYVVIYVNPDYTFAD